MGFPATRMTTVDKVNPGDTVRDPHTGLFGRVKKIERVGTDYTLTIDFDQFDRPSGPYVGATNIEKQV